MAKRRQTARGIFVPQNPGKIFAGDPTKIEYRSSWEWTVMRKLDQNPNVIGWSSETCRIPYRRPDTGQMSVYVPDLVVVYADPKTGKKRCEMLEIKPAKEVPFLMEGFQKLTKKDQAAQIINMAKWEAAMMFCKKRGIHFQVMTEYQIYPEMRRKLAMQMRKKK